MLCRCLHGRFVFAISLLLLCELLLGHQEFPNQQWTKDFAVEVESDDVAIELEARSKGFKLVRKIHGINVLHFHHPDACAEKHRCKRHATDLVELLKNTPGVKRVEQQYLLERDMRWLSEALEEPDTDDVSFMERKKDEIYRKNVVERHREIGFDFNDPLYPKQWHLDNYGQLVNPGLDLNLLPAWRKGYMGQNINVVVVDDGIDTRHKDLKSNYVPLLSADLDNPLDRSGNPASKGPVTPEDQSHGTSCAGEIAAEANNGVCGVGVAPLVRLGGVRILAGHVTDLQEAYSVLHQYILVHLRSNSWGPTDNGKKLEMPKYYTAKAIEVAATKGRNGLGAILVFASGNGGYKDDNCGADGYTNAPHTMPMGSVNAYGHTVAYGERCSAIFAVTPVGGWSAPDAKIDGKELPARIITTGINQGCNRNFLGTSAATPLGAGCMALVVQANPKLTWRDVQHVASRTSRLPNDMEIVWQRNGAGLHVSHHFGFGLLDCSKAVRVAQNWTNVGPRLRCDIPVFSGKERIYMNRQRRYYIRHDKRTGHGNCSSLNAMEHATVTVRIDHKLRGDLELWLISPSGTVSRLLGTRERDRSREGISFTFLTRFVLGEAAHGTWIFEVRDTGRHPTRPIARGAVRQVSLTLFGTRELPADLRSNENRKAYKMTAREVRRTYVAEREATLGSFPEHRDVLELKRALAETETSGRELSRALIEKVERLKKDKFVTADEIQSVLKVMEKLKKST